ncbi:cupin domain-containing protein [Thalassospiraceae bacterium LMO-JJ14]|nr:cupin domain-containing protein [Thalassospiraceae bacterium LMO-JJ14]
MAGDMTAEDLIINLGLQPLPWEGGWYRETWRTDATVPRKVLGEAYTGPRSTGTAIYYLLTPETVSRMHRLPSDETFHFYLGDPVEMLLLYASDEEAPDSEIVTFGQELLAGQCVQFTVPGNAWMGARLKAGGVHGYALMGTTVSPGFDFDDLEMGAAETLATEWPSHADLIKVLA